MRPPWIIGTWSPSSWATHGALVAAAPESCDGAPAAVDVGDATVAEAGAVLHGLRDALVIGGLDHIDARRRDRPADDHHGKLSAQSSQTLGRRLWAEQDQGLAAGVEQRLDGPRLVATVGDRAENES